MSQSIAGIEELVVRDKEMEDPNQMSDVKRPIEGDIRPGRCDKTRRNETKQDKK
jgi:hypothetical protein